MPEAATSLRIFISYSHDTPAYKKLIAKFSNRLRQNAIDAVIDQAVEVINVPASWPNWMMQQIESATYVLVACSEIYKKRFEGREIKGKGKGAKYEGSIINQGIYEAEGESHKFIPIILSDKPAVPGDQDLLVPSLLRQTTIYDLRHDGQFEGLLRRLFQKPEYIPEPLGNSPVFDFPTSDLKSTTPVQTLVPPTTAEFEKDLDTYGVFADEAHFQLKIDASGRGLLTCRVTNLQTIHSDLKAIEFSFGTIAGICGQPRVGKLGVSSRITWHPVESPLKKGATFEEIVRYHRTVDGEFRFADPLSVGDPPRSFDFEIEFYNAFATTADEFNLYYSKSDQTDADGFPLNEPSEYFLRPVWWPVKKLIMDVTVANTLPEAPHFSTFQVKNRQILTPPEDGKLLSARSPKWTSKPEWSRDVQAETKDNSTHFSETIEYPKVGRGYQLRWKLPVPMRPLTFREDRPEQAIARLLELRNTIRELKPGTEPGMEIQLCWDSFARFSRRIAHLYQAKEKQEYFDVSLLVFEQASLRLRIVLGWTANGMFPGPDSEFGIPPGVGTAGEAFKSGRVTWFIRQESGKGNLGIYIPSETGKLHSAILAVPVVHPDFHRAQTTEGMSRDELARHHLIGIVSIGSRSATSGLYFLGKRVLEAAERGDGKAVAEADELAKECQEAGELILARLQV